MVGKDENMVVDTGLMTMVVKTMSEPPCRLAERNHLLSNSNITMATELWFAKNIVPLIKRRRLRLATLAHLGALGGTCIVGPTSALVAFQPPPSAH
jgi:hypothetical protein